LTTRKWTLFDSRQDCAAIADCYRVESSKASSLVRLNQRLRSRTPDYVANDRQGRLRVTKQDRKFMPQLSHTSHIIDLMEDKTIELTVVTPCFNEESTVRACVVRVSQALRDLNIVYEHILVDNASTDSTLETMLALRREFPQVRILANEINIGVFRSIQKGLSASKGRLVVPFLPADCQDPPELLPQMLDIRERTKCQTVAGVRKIRHDGFIIGRFRQLFYSIIRASSRGTYREGASEFRLIESSAALRLAGVRDATPFFRVYMAQIQGRVEYIEYEMTKRTAGKSSASFTSLVDDAMNGILLAIPSIFSRLLVLVSVSFGVIPIVLAVLWMTGSSREYSFSQILAGTGIPFILLTLLWLQLFVGHYIYVVHAQLRAGPETETTEL